MKKKFLIPVLSILSCFIISVFIEIFAFNFVSVFQGSSNPSIDSVPFEVEKTEEETTVSFNLENQYAKKLILSYETDKKFDYEINYTAKGLFGRDKEETIKDVFERKIKRAVLNIGSRVSKVSIVYKNIDTEFKYTSLPEETAKKNEITFNNISIDNSFSFNAKRFFVVSLALVTILCLFFFYKNGFKTEKLHIYFGIVATLLGTMFIVSQPTGVFYAMDDQTHFERVVGLFGGTISYTNGEYNSTDADIANSVGRDSVSSIEEQSDVENYLDSDIDKNYTQAFGFYSSYSKIPYLPMAIGYHGAKIFGLPFSVCFFIGRMFNLLTYVLLLTFAIKRLLTGKLLLTLLALLPATLFQAGTYSYDPIVFAGVAVFLVEFLNIVLDNKRKIDFKSLLLMIGSISFAGLAKAPYALFLLLLLFIPKDRFAIQKNVRWVKAGIIGITILLLGTLVLPSLAGNNIADSRGGETSVKDQAILMIKHPIDYLQVLKGTAVEQSFYKFVSPQTLSSLGYINKLTEFDNLYYIIFILIIFVVIAGNEKNNLAKKYRILLLIGVAGIVLFIWTSLYLVFTPVGLYTINGVQNRYFLPLLFPLLFALQPKCIKNSISRKTLNSSVVSIITVSVIIVVLSLVLSKYSF